MQLSGNQYSSFVQGLCKEILHGVSLPQLHKRLNQFLLQCTNSESFNTFSSITIPQSLADGAPLEVGKAKSYFASNMSQDWLF